MEPTWLVTFVTMNTLLNVTPGPAVLQVVGHSMANGWRPAQASILGILAANAAYTLCSALGVGAVILAAPRRASCCWGCFRSFWSTLFCSPIRSWLRACACGSCAVGAECCSRRPAV